MALIGRYVGHLMGSHWFLQMVYGVFIGERKFLHLWIWVLAFELVGTPFGYHKFKGGLVSNFVGFHLRYDLCQVGISDKRGEWLCGWVDQVSSKNFVVATRDFSEFLGRLGFVSQLLTWMKPHLAPLYSWAAAVAPGTVGRLPETVILTTLYIASGLSWFLQRSRSSSVRKCFALMPNVQRSRLSSLVGSVALMTPGGLLFLLTNLWPPFTLQGW